MEIQGIFFQLLNIIVASINFVGIIIIIWGFVVAVLEFIRIKLHSHDVNFFLTKTNKIRAVLGTYILFGLEFMIAADIIHTFIQPTQEDLIILATIVGIRTVISYFLSREIEDVKHKENS